MTPTACVIGWPIEHSRSPLIHRFWLKRHGIAGDYVRHAVAPDEARNFFRTFKASGFIGANVTLPHKEVAAASVDRRTETAERLGAVNTLWVEGEALCGDNTDVAGFLANLDHQASGWDSGGPALVLGAGGSARAVVDALLVRGMGPVWVLNRTPERALQLAASSGGAIEAGPLDLLPERLAEARLVVNTTSAGLGGGDPLNIDWAHARQDAVVTDIVYVPLLTAFLAGARQRGLQTVDGLGMLLHQAVPGFERWFGVRPFVDDALRAHVLADLAR